MKLYLVLIGLVVIGLLSGCGDNVTTETRTITVGEPGRSADSEGRAGEQKKERIPDGKQPSEVGSADEESEPTAPEGTTLLGALVSVDALGLIQGWAVDQDDASKTILIDIYMGGDSQEGALVGTVAADQSGFDGNQAGNHRFEYAIPDAYRDGSEQLLHLVMRGDDEEGPLTEKLRPFVAYMPTDAGRNYYQGQLLGRLQNACQGCHPGEVNYENHYRLLLDLPPDQGGQAATNRLVRKANGQLNHGGGNRCGAINNGNCGRIQQWWSLEFGG